MRKRSIVFKHDFTQIEKAEFLRVWDYIFPWGNIDDQLQMYDPMCVRLGNTGAVLELQDAPDDAYRRYLAGMLYYKAGKNYKVGKNTHILPAFQEADFMWDIEMLTTDVSGAGWLLSKARMVRGVESILPEIDWPEFGLPGHKSEMGLSVHSGITYHSPDHKIWNKIRPWATGLHRYEIRVRRNCVHFAMDEKWVDTRLTSIRGYLVPLFTIAVPSWITTTPTLGDKMRIERIVVKQ